MKAVVQRVREAGVHIAGREYARIGRGLLVLLGVRTGDTNEDLEWICGKISRLRIFANDEGVMDLDVSQADGRLMVISQFTLLANTAKGNRPSYIAAARPEEARPMYDQACERLSALCGRPVERGVFGADMQVTLVNDGPVTIMLDSRQRDGTT